MTLKKIQNHAKKRAIRNNSKVSFSDTEYRMKYEQIVENAKNCKIESSALINAYIVQIQIFSPVGSSGDYTRILMEIFDYWVQFAKIHNINEVIVTDLHKWKGLYEYVSLLQIANTLGFQINDDRNEGVLQVEEYHSFFEPLQYVSMYFKEKQANNPISVFDRIPIFHDYKTHQFYGEIFYVEGIELRLDFYYHDNQYYFCERTGELKVYFNENNFHTVIENYFLEYKEEQKLKILVDPPVRNLKQLLIKLPGSDSKELAKDIMLSLVERGYSYQHIESFSEQLVNLYLMEFKKTGPLYSNYGSKHLENEGKELSFGWFNVLPYDVFIQFQQHFVLLWTDFNSDIKVMSYEIFESKESLISFIKEKTSVHLNKLLSV